MNTQQSADTKIALLEAHIDRMEEHLEANDKRIDKLIEERDKALRWGILAMGSLVVSLVTLIANFVADHVK